MVKRKKLTIAFDCDETLWDNEKNEMIWNAVVLFKALQRLPHTEMFVWSHGGEEWAEEVAQRCGLTDYKVIHKPYPIPEDKSGLPDIAVDDFCDCAKLVTIFVE